MEEKKLQKDKYFTLVFVTAISIASSLWLFLESSPARIKMIALIEIPCLLFLGITIGRFSRDKEMMNLAKEVDEFEEKLQACEKKLENDSPS